MFSFEHPFYNLSILSDHVVTLMIYSFSRIFPESSQNLPRMFLGFNLGLRLSLRLSLRLRLGLGRRLSLRLRLRLSLRLRLRLGPRLGLGLRLGLRQNLPRIFQESSQNLPESS